MLKYLTHSEINIERWDACVQQSAEKLLYANAGYLNTLTGNCWDAVVELQNGEYLSVFPLPFKKRLGVRFVYQPLFTQQLGLFTTSASQFTTVADYLAQIPGHFRKVYLQLNTGNTFGLGTLPAGFSAVPRVTYHLGLNEPYEALQDRYAKNLKRSVKKGREKHFEVEASENLSDLILLYRETVGKKVPDLKDRHYAALEKQYAFLRKNNFTQLLEIRQAGELVAGALFLVQEHKLIYLFSASAEAGKKYGAMAVIIDEMIRENAGQECVLDFEGSVIPSLAQFFGSFGAKPVTYLSVSRNNLPWYLKWLIK